MNRDRRITREELKTAVNDAYISFKNNKKGKMPITYRIWPTSTATSSEYRSVYPTVRP